jgi:4,5-DOPA dioxygenase extradiol
MFADSLPPVRSILIISAHWYVRGTGVTAISRPRTIHDFAGFPLSLSTFEYEAPGDPDLARSIATSLAPIEVSLDHHWGIDHGAWSVLCRMFPKANIPVVQLSIDATQGGAYHFNLGRRLRELRSTGVLVIGSGNIVHNLRATFQAPGGFSAPPFDWTVRFDQLVRSLIEDRSDTQLTQYHTLSDDAGLAVPTPDHYLPLLYVLGARYPDEEVRFLSDGYQGAGLSMTSVAFGSES